MAVNFIKNPTEAETRVGHRHLNFVKNTPPSDFKAEAKRLAKEEEDLKAEREAFEAEKAAVEPEAKPKRRYVRRAGNA